MRQLSWGCPHVVCDEQAYEVPHVDGGVADAWPGQPQVYLRGLYNVPTMVPPKVSNAGMIIWARSRA